MYRHTFCFVLVILAACQAANNDSEQRKFRNLKLSHQSVSLTDDQIGKLASLTDIGHMNEILKNICVPRVVGTPTHTRVKKYIKRTMETLGWTVETDVFKDKTPNMGELEFENIIAKWNPNAQRYLTLACHYDSKYTKEGNFVGAVDSAVPCAQLINLAKVMSEQLQSIKNNDLSLMLLFLDGEEAFETWGPKDSLYGARNLASKWSKQFYSHESGVISDLDKIDLFVLLDLIGAPDPKFYNYFPATTKWYSLLMSIESKLANMMRFERYSYGQADQKYFLPYQYQAGIQDDHIPFLERDVRIVHLIPTPFPQVWHKISDDLSNIDISTTENLNKIFRIFVASYLHMKV